MAKYRSSGELPILNEVAPQYLDASAPMDFQSSMLFIANAKTLFAELPSTIRTRFDNDPGAFINFCSAEKNRPELEEMGLLKPETEWVKPPASDPPVVVPAVVEPIPNG